ncbi:endocuticle structural glycoprotein SgAbd-8-like [Ischnura elegans]|uniref:endocuticle structural glycoprotein SgAbd-8-like n=1 Tax=Ischnura elegans TaxID=197161 RepID=UPI001ED87A98|nr:endocuticle structural glycoprotein SgAbd-8-like [Ischnura elegans]
MKLIILLSCVVAALAFPQKPEQQVPILSSENEVNFDGSYRYSYEGGDGTSAQQAGQLKQVGPEAGVVNQGSYSYAAPDGSRISLTYTADEFGYHPQGDHLPVAPPIPPEIQKSLDFIASIPVNQREGDQGEGQ